MDDTRLHDYPQRQSQPLGGPEMLLPVSSLDLLQREPDVTSDGLQVAKLDPLSGWRLWVTHFCLELNIIATSLVTIAAAFEDGQNANWVVASYLITYTSFLIIFARLSDLFGRKPTLISAIVIFTSFSAACGGAQSMTQLIILRAFQGIGGAGLYSLGMSVMMEVTPFKYIGIATGLLGPTFATSSFLGPVLGGVITTCGSWRWVFFINVPVGLCILCVVAWVFPVNSQPLPIRQRTFSFVDYPGMLLSLAGLVAFIYAVEKGGARQAWESPDIVATITVSAVAMTGFVVWEWLVSNAKIPKVRMLPLFPVNLVQTRVLGSIFLTAFITGFPLTVTTIYLPQRFQLQNSMSAMDAGLRMLPLLMLSAVGAGVGGAIVRWWNISWYILASSCCLQTVALGLMATLPTTGEVARAQYGYQAMLGLGFGLTLSSFLVLARLEVSGKDSGITVGAVTQIRILGGLFGVAIAQAVISELVAAKLLHSKLSHERVEAILMSPATIKHLPPAVREAAVQAYGEAFNLLNKIAAGLSAAALLACLGAWRRHPLEPSEVSEGKS
ncbi:hypothetical protein PG985_003949 [Apiospora marii]|uniref:uncharacterized protein n=1 Tax=Apiospora marii TaxID=335849 RepID=UPI003130D3E3